MTSHLTTGLATVAGRLLLFLATLSCGMGLCGAADVFPAATWETRPPESVGLSAAKLDAFRDYQCDHLSSYSFMWWLNGVDRHGKRHWPDAPLDTYGAFGHGGPRVMVVLPSLDLVMAWNDAKIRSRDAENTALKLLAEACAIRTNAPARTGMFFPPPGEAMTNQARRQPAEVGLNPEIISALKSPASKGRWALWRDGFLVHVEGNFNQKQDVASLRKTWHALTVGAAIQQGKIPSYSQKISVWNKELTGLHAEATWWHVLTQTAGFDEGRPEEDRRAWWSAYLAGGVWEAHVRPPYDRPMSAWETVWTELGGTRAFMESLPFWDMQPANEVVKSGQAFCLAKAGEAYAFYLPEGGGITAELPEGNDFIAAWWNPANGRGSQFQNESRLRGGRQTLIPPAAGDWAARIVRRTN